MFGAMGVASDIGASANYAEQVGLTDPSLNTEGQLASYLVGKYGLSGSKNYPAFTKETAPKDLSAWVSGKGLNGLVLDVKTYSWNYQPLGFGFDSYDVGYGARMTLLDAKTGRVLAASNCNKSMSDVVGTMLPRDEITKNNAARLKRVLTQLSNACVSELKQKLG